MLNHKCVAATDSRFGEFMRRVLAPGVLKVGGRTVDVNGLRHIQPQLLAALARRAC